MSDLWNQRVVWVRICLKRKESVWTEGTGTKSVLTSPRIPRSVAQYLHLVSEESLGLNECMRGVLMIEMLSAIYEVSTKLTYQ